MRSRSKKIESVNTRLEWIPLGDLTYDADLQQGRYSKRHAQEIAADLNLDLVGEIHCWRNGASGQYGADHKYSVIDGWHRHEAMLMYGFTPEDRVECRVHLATNKAEASRSFLLLSKRLGHRPVPRFLVRVRAKDPDAVAINDVVNGVGLHVGESQSDGVVRAVAALEKVYSGDRRVDTEGDPELLRKTLRVLMGAWGKSADGLDGSLIGGVGAVLRRYGSRVDTARLIKKLASYPGRGPGLIGTARGIRDMRGGSLTNCTAGAIVALYNKGTRGGGLTDWWAS